MLRRRLSLAAALFVLIGPTLALARDGETPSKTKAAASASEAPAPRPLEPEEETAPLPAGHPVVAPDDEEARPADAHAAVPGMFQPPPDVSEEDPALPSGTLSIEVRDPDNRPLGMTPLVLVVLHQSVAKGQSKENRPLQTDQNGRLRLDHLEIGSSVSYWIKHQTSGATFASTPTQLGPARGVHVILHVYPVVHDIESAMVVSRGAIYFEVKDDRVQVEEAITFFNFGRTAWAPESLIVKLPSGFTALTSQAQMSDQGVDSVEKEGARIRGTFGPGQHDLDFRWQLPYEGEKELAIDVNLPPHVAIWRVMAAAGRDTSLDVAGFPEAQKRTDRQGQHLLVTEAQVKREAPLTSLHVMIRGLMVPGPGRIIATAIAAAGVLLGVFLGARRRPASMGGVKSQTYEKARRQLVDAIAETLEVVT
jgi:hypothetical protein